MARNATLLSPGNSTQYSNRVNVFEMLGKLADRIPLLQYICTVSVYVHISGNGEGGRVDSFFFFLFSFTASTFKPFSRLSLCRSVPDGKPDLRVEWC